MKRVAVIGASRDRSKFGNKAVRAYRDHDYEVIPVHRTERQIEGINTVQSILDVPQPIDRITVYLRPKATLEILADIAMVRSADVWFNPGSDDEAIREKALTLAISAIYGCSIVDIGANPADY